MASGGSSGRPAHSSGRPLDFVSDDVLRSYDDFAAQNPSGAKRSDSPLKENPESRKGRPLINIYEQEECSKEDVLSSVDKCMKKYADNVLRILEGMNSRLSQLEIHSYKLDRSIAEFRADIIRDHADAEQRFKTLEKQIQEVHRAILIVRDKQELAETKKELTKVQLVHKESAQMNQDSVKQSVTQLKKTDDQSDTAKQNLALALPHQGSGPDLSVRASEHIQLYKQVPLNHPAAIIPNVQQDHYIVNQPGTFYQSQLLQPDLQYVQARPQDIPIHIPKQQLQSISQNQPTSFPQRQQQWMQQLPQQFPQHEVTASSAHSHTQMRSQMSYPPYPPQTANATSESFSVGTHVQVSYPAAPQPNNIHPEASFAYSGTGSSVSQASPQHNVQRQAQPPTRQSAVGLQSNGGYAGTATYPPQFNIQGYNDAYSYQSGNLSALQNQPPSHSSGLHQHGTKLIRSHPHGEMIERVIGMGYTRDQVASVIERMLQSGQPIDFNALLDRLNGQAAGVSPRVW